MLDYVRHRYTLLAVGMAVIGATVLALHAAHYLPFFSDDALISLRYSQRLLGGDGLTWTEGPRVEGYSNLLWVLLVALLGVFKLDWVTAARLLGLAGMSLVVGTLCLHDRRRAALVGAAVAVVFFSLAAPNAIWAIGGLEQPLLAGALALSLPPAFSLVENKARPTTAWMLGGLFGLICLTRPDGPLFVFAFGLTWLFLGRLRDWRGIVPVIGVAMVFWVAQMLFRLAYYGDWLPNPARVKLMPSALRWAQGLEYVRAGWMALAPLSWLALVASLYGLGRASLRARSLLVLVTSLLWLGYVAFIGGDIFPGWRHFVPVIVLWAFLLAAVGDDVFARLRDRPAMLASMSLLLCGLLLFFVVQQFSNSENRRALAERWEWDGRALGLMLKQAFGVQQPLLAVTAAGCLPFWSELPALDMLGLNDAWLPRHPPADFGSGPIGHELGSGRYVLERAPDLIVFHIGDPNPLFRTGGELSAMPEFRLRYAAARMRLPQYTATVYVQRDSTKLGWREDADRIEIPAVILATASAAELVIAPNGRLALPINDRNSVVWTQVASDFEIAELSFTGTDTQLLDVRAERSKDLLRLDLRHPDPFPVLIESLRISKRPRS